MDANRDALTDCPDVRVLSVGPPEWQSRIDSAFEDVSGCRRDVVESVDAARQALSGDRPVDCVVTAQRLDGGTGVQLAASHGSLPVVVAPCGDAEVPPPTAAGVSWVVPLDAAGHGVTGVAGLAAVVARECEDAPARRRSARFRAAFDDPDRFVGTVAADGTVRSLNDAAAAVLGPEARTHVGKRLWALPWRASDVSRREVQHAVRRAAGGEYVSFEGGFAPRDDRADAESTFEFRVQPTGSDGEGDLLVQGIDLTEREELEAELRASEELHRVTLNNMTDTVLVTDDRGEFTYVCPNVHFIFGYSAEEIRELGSIDALLGEDLFDTDRLASDGVITNIECTATDKDGNRHVLLVNVRNVSIQDGTRLYSCRDITKRKQREEALTQVQRTSRELLYAETRTEVAEQVVGDATAALTDGGVALYQLDTAANVLYPVAAAPQFWDRLGSIPEVSLDQRTAVSRAFVEEETVTASGLDVAGPLDSMDDVTAIPLGDHGVLVVGTADGRSLAAVDVEVGELLAATTEAAYDRLERESELREADATLRERNQRLSELDQVNEMIRDVDRELVHAESRSDLEAAVCERLVDGDRFTFAWIGELSVHEQHLRPREWAGDDGGYLDDVGLSMRDESPHAEPALRTARDRSMTVVSNVADQLRAAPWCKAAVSRNFNAVLSIPLVYDDVLYGTLTVYEDEADAFSETVREVFAELGDTIGAALNSIQRKEALRSDSVTRLSYAIRDPSSLLLRLARALDCTLDVVSEVTRADDASLLFVAVDGADPAAVVEEATASVDVAGGETVRGDDEEGLVSLRVNESFVTSVLASHGATRRSLEATPDHVSLVVEVPDAATTRAVDETLSARFSNVELLSQRTETRTTDAAAGSETSLTDRQSEVLQVAYHTGFFDADRDVTGRDVAETLGISHTAFYDHVRRVEQKLFAQLFERPDQHRSVE